MTSDLRRQLEARFREQQQFADGYSPLYAHLFGCVADWLASEGEDALVAWLLRATADREPFDVTLLLLAALHRDVLAGEPAVAAIAPYYGEIRNYELGIRNEEEASQGALPVSPAPLLPGPPALRAALLARRDAYAAFIGRSPVQTNETGRGVAWLLPVACLGWPAVHLIELGASAGLNLVAERRGYRLVDGDEPERVLLELGEGPPQFTMMARGLFARSRHFSAALENGDKSPDYLAGGKHFSAALENGDKSPDYKRRVHILSRDGGDIHPFHLCDAADELTLAAYVWGDQPQRMARLREGIAALRAVEQSDASVRLWPLRLPDELPSFLGRMNDVIAPPANRGMNPAADTQSALKRTERETRPPQPASAGFRVPAAGFNPSQDAPNAPIVLFNTIMTMYLPDRGASLRGMVDEWARRQVGPVLWLQWEPAWAGPPPPVRDWAAWTADYWPNDGSGATHRWQLGWVHPHGLAVEFGEGWAEFLSNAMQN